MARLYGYCRKSTEEQNETSFSVQEEYIRNYARNIEGIDEIIIITETGSGSSLEGRPLFKSLLESLRPNDIVSVYDSSRISRNTEDALSIIRTISQKGARLMVAGKFIDPNSPIDTMLWSVQSSFDTYQRQIQNQKSRQGIDAKKLSPKTDHGKLRLDLAKDLRDLSTDSLDLLEPDDLKLDTQEHPSPELNEPRKEELLIDEGPEFH